MVLAIATMLVKVIGAVFKIPLDHILHSTGMGYFSAAYSIFTPLNSLAIAGFPVAVSKMVSESVARGRYRDVRRIRKISSRLFFITGLCGFAIMFFGARLLVELINNPGSYWSVLALAPAIFFCCIMSSIRGYYQGLSNMVPTATSQVVEAVAKLGAGLALAYFAMDYAQRQYAETGSIFGQVCATAEEAQVVTYQLGSAGAILGITISTFCGAAFLVLRHRLKGDGITREELRAAPEPKSNRQILRRMVALAIPVCLGSLAVNLSSLVDTTTILGRLEAAIESNGAYFQSTYADLLNEGGVLYENLATSLFGIYSGKAVTIFNLVPAFCSTLGVSAIPSVAAAWALKNRRDIRRSVESVMRVTSMIAMPAGIGLCVLAEPVLTLLYGSNAQEVAVCVPLMQVMGIASIFAATVAPLNSTLQAVGRVDVPVKLMVIAGVIKFVLNYIFVGMPQINIHAAPYSTLICYLVAVVLGMVILRHTVQVRLNFTSMFLKPLIASLFCGVTAWLSYSLLSRFIQSRLVVFGAIVLAALVYAVVLLLIRGVAKNDVLMLPKGEKIAKILEKHSLLG